MQFDLVAILFVCVAVAWAEDKSCAGGYKNGETVERGRYWYFCQDGQLVPKGCFSDSKAKLNLHESFKSGGYILECVIDNNGYLSFAYKGCVSETGKETAPGDTWEDDKYWYSCSTEGDHLKMDVGGCVYENKRYNVSKFYKSCNSTHSFQRNKFFFIFRSEIPLNEENSCTNVDDGPTTPAPCARSDA